VAAPRKKKSEAEPQSQAATPSPATMTSRGDAAEQLPPSDTNGTLPESPPPANGNGERRPLRVFSYLIGPETYVQCSVWQRDAQRRDGTPFTTYDCSVRKRYVDSKDGQWKSTYSFHASELYAVTHALDQAAGFITELRAAEIPF
jgi:hypothetical protein